MKRISKYQAATAVSIFFHSIGLIGLLFFDKAFFSRATPFNLLLSFSLLIWTQEKKNTGFLLFTTVVFCTSFFLEVAGVKTGFLFGDYQYTSVLGIQFLGVPLLIGANWFMIIYCAGISTQTLLSRIIGKAAAGSDGPVPIAKAMAVIIDGATLAVFFDWLMEPVAIKLGFWTWLGNGAVPLYNYICWLLVSMLLLAVFHFCPFDKENKFAINLLLIQALFFLILRTFMN